MVSKNSPNTFFAQAGLWQLLDRCLAGGSIKAAVEALDLPFALETLYHVLHRLRQQLAGVRSRPCRQQQPPASSQTDPLLQTIEHLRSLFPQNDCPVADFQLHFHSVLGMSPLHRFALDRNRVRFLPPNEANDELFFVEEERHVRADNTFSFQAVRFEAPRHLPDRTIQVRFQRKATTRRVVVYRFEAGPLESRPQTHDDPGRQPYPAHLPQHPAHPL